MQFLFKPMDEANARRILTWRYRPPYHVYNMSTGGESEVVMAEAVAYFLAPENRFHAVFAAKTAELLAFVSYGPDGQVPGGDYSEPALDIGMGVHPDWTGKGYGRQFAEAAIKFAEQTFAPTRLRVTIADFNQRAQRVWRYHGFRLVQKFMDDHSGRPFIVFVRDENEDHIR